MSLLGAAAIGAGGSILGGLIGASSAKDVNSQSVKASREINEKQIAFARESAQNKYQWSAKDMRSAGINPLLMMSHGVQGANTPASSTPSFQNPGSHIQAGFTGAGQNLAAGINSAAAVKNAETQAAVGHANVAIASEQVLNLASQRNLNYAQTYKLNQEVTNLVEQLNLTREQSALAFAQTQFHSAQSRKLNLSNQQLSILTRFYREHENSLVAKDMNMSSIIKTILPGLEDTLKQIGSFTDRRFKPKLPNRTERQKNRSKR